VVSAKVQPGWDYEYRIPLLAIALSKDRIDDLAPNHMPCPNFDIYFLKLFQIKDGFLGPPFNLTYQYYILGNRSVFGG
jgi:hypothetical protein